MAKRADSPGNDADELAIYVEELARVVEVYGNVPRIAGRIYAHLVLSDAPLTLTDLTEQLGISKASASAMTRQLVALGLIENVPVPGARREHFRVVVRGWTRTALSGAQGSRRYAEVAERGIELLGDRVSPAVLHLTEMRDLFHKLAEVLEETLSQYEDLHLNARESRRKVGG